MIASLIALLIAGASLFVSAAACPQNASHAATGAPHGGATAPVHDGLNLGGPTG